MEPVQTYLKNNKRGLGADKIRKAVKPPDSPSSNHKNDQVSSSESVANSNNLKIQPFFFFGWFCGLGNELPRNVSCAIRAMKKLLIWL